MEKSHNIRLALKIIEFLIENKEDNIRNIAIVLREDYKSVYYEVGNLKRKGLIRVKKIGKSNLCSLIRKPNPLIILTEFKRRDKFLKNRDMAVIYNRLRKIK